MGIRRYVENYAEGNICFRVDTIFFFEFNDTNKAMISKTTSWHTMAMNIVLWKVLHRQF